MKRGSIVLLLTINEIRRCGSISPSRQFQKNSNRKFSPNKRHNHWVLKCTARGESNKCANSYVETFNGLRGKISIQKNRTLTFRKFARSLHKNASPHWSEKPRTGWKYARDEYFNVHHIASIWHCYINFFLFGPLKKRLETNSSSKRRDGHERPRWKTRCVFPRWHRQSSPSSRQTHTFGR